MQQWEYCYIGISGPKGGWESNVWVCTLQGNERLYSLPTPNGFEPLRLIAWLGLQGWEICSFQDNGQPLYFKRQKRD